MAEVGIYFVSFIFALVPAFAVLMLIRVIFFKEKSLKIFAAIAVVIALVGGVAFANFAIERRNNQVETRQ